jgi:hypothetical protein
MNLDPSDKKPDAKTPASSEIVGEVFGFGNPGITQETFEDGKRILRWIPGTFDEQISSVAGWSDLVQSYDDVSSLEIPQGARSAGSVLSGLEAWKGEKAKILGSIATYQSQILNEFGAFDTSLTLDSVAVTKEDHSLVVLPPHTLSAVESEYTADWLNALKEDLKLVLVTDPNQEQLIERFIEDVQEIGAQ